MATKIYLPSSGTPDITGLAIASGWDQGSSGSFYRAPCSSTKGSTALTTFTSRFASSSTGLICTNQFISPPLSANFTFDNANTWSYAFDGYEANAAVDGQFAITLRVVQSDHSTIRGTPISLSYYGGEVGTSLASKYSANAGSFNTVNAVTGDHLVIELGFRGLTPSTSYDIYGRYGEDGSADFASGGDTSTTKNPWWQTTGTITFGTDGVQVAQTLVPTYNIRTKVGQTVAPSYNIRTKVAQTVAPSYNILTAVAQTLAPSYNIKVLVAQSIQPDWDIAALVAQTLVPVYDILSGLVQVAQTLVPTWNIRTLIAQTLVPTYNIRTTVAQTSSPVYNIAAKVAQTLVPQYDIAVLVAQTTGPEYDILTAVAQTLVADFDIAVVVTQTLDGAYDIHTKAASAITPVYNIGDAEPPAAGAGKGGLFGSFEPPLF